MPFSVLCRKFVKYLRAGGQDSSRGYRNDSTHFGDSTLVSCPAISLSLGTMWRTHCVPCRDSSRHFPLSQASPGVATSGDAARTSACATSARSLSQSPGQPTRVPVPKVRSIIRPGKSSRRDAESRRKPLRSLRSSAPLREISVAGLSCGFRGQHTRPFSQYPPDR